LTDSFTAIKKYEKRNVYKLVYIPIDKEDRIIEIETPNVIITQTTNQSIDTPTKSFCSESSFVHPPKKVINHGLRLSSNLTPNQLNVSHSITPKRDKSSKSPIPKSPNVNSGNSSHKKTPNSHVATTVSTFCTKKKK
jgi:hypothetical protein